MPSTTELSEPKRTPGCRAVILCLLAVALVATAAAQGARGADVSDPRAGGGLADTRFAEETLSAFRVAYAEMGRPRMELQMVRASSSASTGSGAGVEDKSSSRDVERSVTRVLRLGGAILEDPRASVNSRESSARSNSPMPGNLVVEVRVVLQDGGSIALRASRKSDGRLMAQAECEGTSARAAESATLKLLRQLADYRPSGD